MRLLEIPITNCNGNRCDYFYSWSRIKESGKICPNCELYWAATHRTKEFIARYLRLVFIGPKADPELAKLFDGAWINIRRVIPLLP